LLNNKRFKRMAYEKPAYGQLRASNELAKQGILVSEVCLKYRKTI
jgi:hypothetical protein